MKNIFLTIIIFVAATFFVNAQSETQAFDADGIKVIFKPTSKNVINIRVYFRGGVTNYPANQAGIENVALDAATKCGTGNYSAGAVKDTSDKYGILMYGTSTYDYGYIQLNCISKYFNKGWELFSDVVMNPAFNDNEVKLLKDNDIGLYRTRESNPNTRLNELQMESAFSNTPYAILPGGNEQTLGKLTSDDLKNYYKSILNKNQIFIVAVGNITKQELFEKILYSFSNIPSRPYNPVELQAPVWKDNKLFAEKRPLATNYIGAIMNSPEFKSENYVPFCLGISGLGGNLYRDLRSERRLSFSPTAGTFSLKMPFAQMTAGTTNVQEVAYGMLKELKRIQNSGMDEEWLQHLKNIYLTNSYVNEQSAAAITNQLGLAEILGGWQYGDDLTKLVQMVTVSQVNDALNFYIVGLRWSYLGNEDAIEGFKPPAY